MKEKRRIQSRALEASEEKQVDAREKEARRRVLQLPRKA
jgi:hypothetical protein